MDKDLVEIQVDIIHDTDAAYLVSDGITEGWIPKSQVEEPEFTQSGMAVFEIPEWLAIEKGFI